MSTTMFRTTAARSLPRSLQTLNANAARTQFASTVLRAAFRTSARPTKATPALSLALQPPLQKSLVRYNSYLSVAELKKAEEQYQKQKLAATPETVSTESSIHHVNREIGVDDAEKDVDMMAGIRSDFETIKDTFSLRDVPHQAMWVGLAGVVPYLVTSLSTVALSFDIQYAAQHGTGFLFSGHTSEQLLHILEPIQLGYGATIISFLGAIHWGLEFGGFGGYQGYRRYGIGVVATAVAWPTLLLSAEVGLITQFLAFTFLYYADARASARGWAPSWYGIYRFVLTFIVGASIVASLIGRGQIADLVTKPTGAAERMRMLRASELERLEKEDAENVANVEAKGDEDEDEEEDEE